MLIVNGSSLAPYLYTSYNNTFETVQSSAKLKCHLEELNNVVFRCCSSVLIDTV